MSDDLNKELQKPKRPRLNPEKWWSGGRLVSQLTAKESAEIQREIKNAITGKKKEDPMAPLDYSQWLILPDGAFQASRPTVSELVPGVYDLDQDNDGRPIFVLKRLVTDNLFDFGQKESIRVINGIKHFWTKKDEYEKMSLVYKRGILLWGPPGSGKTATLTLLMINLVENGGIVVIAKNPQLLKAGLRQLRVIERERPLIVVFEDVDEIIRKYGEHELLSFLDGENQVDNVVSLATTNYPEELGARIVNRPSRFDEVVKIGMPTSPMRKSYLEHLLRDKNVDFPVDKAIEDTEGLSISHLKELLIAVTCLDQPYDEVVHRLQSMKHKPSSSKDGNTTSVGFA